MVENFELPRAYLYMGYVIKFTNTIEETKAEILDILDMITTVD